MQPYEIHYKILSSDTDMYRRLRISRLFTFLQEAAIAHTEELGAGKEVTLDRGLLWVITLQQAKIERLPVYNEKIRIRTVPGKLMHAFFPRYYQVTDSEEKTLITASALWTLIDAESRKMVTPKDAGVFVEGADPKWETFFPKSPARPNGGKTLTYTVPYSSIDLNGHMNNTRYFDLAEDLMEPGLRKGNITEIRTEYAGEARVGACITLKTQNDNDRFLLMGEDGKRLFRISMQYENKRLQG